MPRWVGLWATCWVWATCCRQREWGWGRPWPQEHGERLSSSLSSSSPQSWSLFYSEFVMWGRRESVKIPFRYCDHAQCGQKTVGHIFVCFGTAVQHNTFEIKIWQWGRRTALNLNLCCPQYTMILFIKSPDVRLIQQDNDYKRLCCMFTDFKVFYTNYINTMTYIDLWELVQLLTLIP